MSSTCRECSSCSQNSGSWEPVLKAKTFSDTRNIALRAGPTVRCSLALNLLPARRMGIKSSGCVHESRKPASLRCLWSHRSGPVQPHIRTTAFWCSPGLFARYPLNARDHASRYRVEHGDGCFRCCVRAQGLQAYVVAFGGEYLFPNWHGDPNSLARGTQYNLLIGDRPTMPPIKPIHEPNHCLLPLLVWI